MKKRQRWSLLAILGTCVLLLIVGYVTVSHRNKTAWKEGIYPFDNYISVYADNGDISFAISTIILGDKLIMQLEKAPFSCYLLNGQQEIPLQGSVTTVNSEKYYSYVDIAFKGHLDIGTHLFSGIRITTEDKKINTILSGNIRFVINPSAEEKVHLVTGIGGGTSSSDFTIVNNSGKSIVISEVFGLLEDGDTFMCVDDPSVESGNTLPQPIAGQIPTLLAPNAQLNISMYYKTDWQKNPTLYLLSPQVQYNFEGEEKTHNVYFNYSYASPYYPYLTSQDVLDYITSKNK